MIPPGLSISYAESIKSRCRGSNSLRSFKDLRHLASGRRRNAPKPEQGASIRIRSNFSPKLAASLPSSETIFSFGTTLATRSARCEVGSLARKESSGLLTRSKLCSSAALPPGPAHKSNHLSGTESLVAKNISAIN